MSGFPDGKNIVNLQQQFVDKLCLLGLIGSPRVEAAFRAVGRELFLPKMPLEQVYSDRCIVTKKDVNGADLSSASQPALVARVLEQLDLQPGQKVLEIGAGTGYNASLMGYIVGAEGQVWSIDIDEDIVQQARQNVAAANVRNVRLLCADGAFGWAADAPFDRIVLTVAATDVAPAWHDQLKPGGRIVVPLSMRGLQKSIAFEKKSNWLESVNVLDCHYIMLRGSLGEESSNRECSPKGMELNCELPEVRKLDGDDLLSQDAREWRTSIRVTMGEVAASLGLWIALQFPGFCTITARSEKSRRSIFNSRTDSGVGVSVGVYRNHTLCVLCSPSRHSGSLEHSPFELSLRNFGPDYELAEQVLAAIRRWAAAGRPDDSLLAVRATRVGAAGLPQSCFLIERRHHNFFFAWNPRQQRDIAHEKLQALRAIAGSSG